MPWACNGRITVTSELEDKERVSGLVKWFDPVKGFGFVVSDAGGPDILLHVNVLRSFGQNSVAEASRIVVDVQNTERGVQALEVITLEPPEGIEDEPLGDLSDVELSKIEQLPLEPARVKWFGKGKGFGFANIFGQNEDIFLHVEVLRRFGLSDLQPGEALAIRVIDGKRGKMAAAVQAWETALSSVT
jgi:CspA family cold shock protein